MAVALPLVMTSVAFAQTAAPTQPSDTGDYTLQVESIKAGGKQGNAAPYQLRGTSISGSSGSASTILTAPIAPGAAPYKTESGVYYYPTVFAGVGHDSNVGRTNANPTASSFVNVAPAVVAEIKSGGDRYTALLSANSIGYDSSSRDNSTSSELTLAGDNYFSSRSRASWSIGQVNGSDPRGSTNIIRSSEPDRWNVGAVNGRLIYGAPTAAARLEVDLGSQAKRYDNNRVNTAVQDLILNSVAARVFYRLGGRTSALAEVSNANANYTSPSAVDSNIERRYYAGLTWDATAATTGIIKVGAMTKDFSLAGKPGYNGGSWEATVRWSPLSYMAIDLQTSRETVDSTGVGDYTLNTGTDLTWNHKWSSSLTSRVALGVLNSDYVGSASSRSDVANKYAFTVDYAVSRWLKLGADLSTTDNASNVSTAAFKRDVLMFTLNASL